MTARQGASRSIADPLPRALVQAEDQQEAKAQW
jgi:hypothetical protein